MRSWSSGSCSQHGLAWLVLLLLYGLSGFALLLGAIMAVYTACLALMRGFGRGEGLGRAEDQPQPGDAAR